MLMLSVLIVTSSCLTSCGVTTQVRVRQTADNTSTTISIKNGEGASTSVSVEPKISVADSVLTIIKQD